MNCNGQGEGELTRTRHNIVSHPSVCGAGCQRDTENKRCVTERTTVQVLSSSIDRVKVSCKDTVTHVPASSAQRRKRHKLIDCLLAAVTESISAADTKDSMRLN